MAPYTGMRHENPDQKESSKRFIKDIEVEVISADVIDKRTHSATKATIAFTVSYNSELRSRPTSGQRIDQSVSRRESQKSGSRRRRPRPF